MVQPSLEATQTTRTEYEQLLVNDSSFQLAVTEIQEEALDFVEGQLLQAIREGNLTAIMFYLKTKGRHRGYTDKGTSELFTEQPLFPDVRPHHSH